MNAESTEIKLEKSKEPIGSSSSVNWMAPIDMMDEWLSEVGFQNLWPLTRPQALPLLRSSFHFKGPSVDIIDRANEVFVKAEIPGLEKKDLSIALQNRVLTLKGKTHHKEEEETGQYFRRELQQGEWIRSLLLPAEVDARHGKAHFKNGILEVVLPKIENATGTTIAID